MNETPTIEADPSWPAWAEWYAINGYGAGCICDQRMYLDTINSGFWDAPRAARFSTVGRSTLQHAGWRETLCRIVRTPKEAATFTLPQAVEAGMAMAPLLEVIEAFAVRLTQHGPAEANYARKALIAANVPVPALVEREATGKDLPEQEAKP